MGRVKQFVTTASQWWKKQRIARALTRYSSGMGRQLSGGIALTGLLSVVAALTLAITAMVGVFRRHPDFQNVVFSQIGNLLPGVIDMGDGGMITPDDLVLNTGWNIAGIVAGLVLLNTATRVIAALRTSLRSMFGLHNAAESFFVGRLRDLAGFVGLALSVLLTALLSVGARAAFDWIHQYVGHWAIFPDSKITLQAITIGIGLVIDAVVFILLFRGLAGARVPWPQLWRGSLLGAVGTGALRYLGTSVVTNVSDNPLLASVAAVATLLVWLNIAARFTLMAAAWTADPPIRPKVQTDELQHMNHTPNYVSMSAPETLEWDYGIYTGLVQPLSLEKQDATVKDATEPIPAPGGSQDKGARNGTQKDASQNQAERETPDGPAPAIRIAPDSPLGKLKEKVTERRRD